MSLTFFNYCENKRILLKNQFLAQISRKFTVRWIQSAVMVSKLSRWETNIYKR